MKLYTGNDIARGAGIFDYVAMTEVEQPERVSTMRTSDAIGVIAAAFASGLETSQVEEFLDTFFYENDHELLCETMRAYDGPDKRFHLWNRRATGTDRLCWDLRYYSRPEWRFDSATSGRIAI